jgi:hypothetical protein
MFKRRIIKMGTSGVKMRTDEMKVLAVASIGLFICVFMILCVVFLTQEIGMVPYPCLEGAVVSGIASLVLFIRYYNLTKTPVCQTCDRRMTYIKWYRQYYCYYCGDYNRFGELYKIE